MSLTELDCARLRRRFERRVAIYVEQGVARVLVHGIQLWQPGCVEAVIDEIPTRGLPSRPELSGQWLIWTTSTDYTENTWSMGQGGWTLQFAPEIVSGVVELASTWPEDLDEVDRYNQALRVVFPRFYAAFDRFCRDSS